MSVFRTIVVVAMMAGAIAGLALTALQHVSTVPLILKAETYEMKSAATESPAGAHEHDASATTAHEHEAAWEPADGFERIAFTTLANVVGGIGFGLLLVAFSEVAGGIAGWRQGVVWGLAGFVVFTLAPAVSLPPELPAMPAADLLPRQIWWVATVVVTAGGLALIVFGPVLWATTLGIALIVAPHVVGAPQPASFETPVPHDLAQRFVTAVTVSGFVFWVLLGGVAGFVRARLRASQ